MAGSGVPAGNEVDCFMAENTQYDFVEGSGSHPGPPPIPIFWWTNPCVFNEFKGKSRHPLKYSIPLQSYLEEQFKFRCPKSLKHHRVFKYVCAVNEDIVEHNRVFEYVFLLFLELPNRARDSNMHGLLKMFIH